MLVAWTTSVDNVLYHCGVDHRCSQDNMSDEHALDGIELCTSASEERVDPLLEYGEEKDDEYGVEKVEHVVGNTRGLHLAGLRDEVIAALVPAEPGPGEGCAGKKDSRLVHLSCDGGWKLTRCGIVSRCLSYLGQIARHT